MLDGEGDEVNTRTVSLSLVTKLMEPYTVSVWRLVTSLVTVGWRLVRLSEAELSDFSIREDTGDTESLSGRASVGDMIVSSVFVDCDGVTDTDPAMMAELSLTLRTRSGNKESC